MAVLYQILESLKFALGALRENLLRTTLSLLGVTVGIVTIVSVLSAVDYIEKGVKENLNFLGSNVIYVETWPWDFVQNPDYPWWKYWQRPRANYQEYMFLKKNVKNSDVVAISRAKGGVTLTHDGSSMGNAGIQGVSEGFNMISDLQIEKGRYFTRMELEQGRNAIILGHEVAQTLFFNEEPIGKTVKRKGLKFVVVGIMEQQGNSSFQMGGATPDLNCLIPYKSFNKFYTKSRRGPEPRIAIKGMESDPGLLELEAELSGLMRQVRGLKPKEDNNFALNRPEMFTTALDSIFAILSSSGFFIGLGAMLVGGFGIANIMFVSVKERTNLIGIQKSLGAQNYFILTQFLFEATFLSVLGGVVGLAFIQMMLSPELMKMVFSALLGSFLHPDYIMVMVEKIQILEVLRLSFSNIATGISISAGLGLLAGFIPAFIASRLDPVIAIRSK